MILSVSCRPRRVTVARCGAQFAFALFMGLSSATYAQTPVGTFASVIALAVADDAAVSGFYRDHDYATLWTGAADATRRAALFAALDNANDHGLPASRYDAAGLRARFAHVTSEAQRARLELAVTRVFLTYAADVQTGFLTPAAVDAGIVRTVPLRDRRATLDAFAAANPGAFIASLPPQVPEYEIGRAHV